MAEGLKFLAGFWAMVCFFLAAHVLIGSDEPFTGSKAWDIGLGVLAALIGLKIALRMVRN